MGPIKTEEELLLELQEHLTKATSMMLELIDQNSPVITNELADQLIQSFKANIDLNQNTQ
jgi:hypothetical protein